MDCDGAVKREDVEVVSVRAEAFVCPSGSCLGERSRWVGAESGAALVFLDRRLAGVCAAIAGFASSAGVSPRIALAAIPAPMRPMTSEAATSSGVRLRRLACGWSLGLGNTITNVASCAGSKGAEPPGLCAIKASARSGRSCRSRSSSSFMTALFALSQRPGVRVTGLSRGACRGVPRSRGHRCPRSIEVLRPFVGPR